MNKLLMPTYTYGCKMENIFFFFFACVRAHTSAARATERLEGEKKKKRTGLSCIPLTFR